MIRRFNIHQLFAALALGVTVAAEDLPVTVGQKATGPSAVGPGTPQRPPQGRLAKPEDWTTDTKPIMVVEDAPEPEVQSTGAGTALPYDFAPPGESAAPPDLSLANARSFTFGLGPSAFGPGIRSTLTTGLLYDDNINSDGGATGSDSGTDVVTNPGTDSESEPESDLVFSVGLQLRAELGTADRGLALKYAIDGYFYADHPDMNALNHALGVSVYRRWGRTKASMNLGYDHATGEDRDVGASTTQDTVHAQLNILQGLGARGQLTGGVDHTSTFYETYDSKETSGRLGFDHALGSKLRLGIEGVVGTLSAGGSAVSTSEPTSEPTPEPTPVVVTGTPSDAAGAAPGPGSGAPPTTGGTGTAAPGAGVPSSDAGAEKSPESTVSPSRGLDQTYAQVKLTLDYHATDRLNANGSFGWESRSTDGGGTQGGFVYDLNLTYRIGRATILNARGSRGTSASAAFDETSRLSTNFEVSVSHPIGRRWVLDLAGGYELSDYADSQDAAVPRQDTYFYFRPTLSVVLMPRLSMSLFYDFRKNESTGEGGRPFEGNRIGTQLTYSF